MSTRQLRRLINSKQRLTQESSDEEYLPSYMQAKASFTALAISTDSDEKIKPGSVEPLAGANEDKLKSEMESKSETEVKPETIIKSEMELKSEIELKSQSEPKTEEELRSDGGAEASTSATSDPTIVVQKSTGAIPKQPKPMRKKKSKSRKKTNTHKTFDDDFDEVERSVKEINAKYGAPPASPAPKEIVPDKHYDCIYKIHPKCLNASNESYRLFGNDEDEQYNRRRSQRNNMFQSRRGSIVPLDAMRQIKMGLTMSVIRRDNDVIHFVFNHNNVYQKRLTSFLRVANIENYNMLLPPEDVLTLQVEAKIQVIDSLLRMEEFTAAKQVLERAIADLQYAAHPFFNYSGKLRLDYVYWENRPFHIVILKYIYMLSNKACHRTALELCKFLLRLDPSDPLAVLTIIDTIALRAREHEWLIKAIEYWSKERHASYLYHIAYSNALAHFHIAKKSDEHEKADMLLRDAIMRFPTVVMRILEGAKDKLVPILAQAKIFVTAEATTQVGLKELILMYATMTMSRWREPAVYDWLKRNVEALVADLKDNDAKMELVAKYTEQRISLFHRTPIQIMRHLCIIKPMSELLVEGIIPHVVRHLPCNPYPPKCTINRYGYIMPPLTSDGFLQAVIPIGDNQQLVLYQ